MFKRRLGIITLAVILCCAMFITACDTVSVKDVEKDPLGQVTASIKTTSDSVRAACSPIAPLEASLTKGTVSLKLDNEEIGKINVNYTLDSANKKFSSAISVESNGTEMALDIFGDNTKLAVESEDLFEGAYGIDLATLADDLKDSPLMSMIGLTDDDLSMVVDAIDDIKGLFSAEELTSSFETLETKMKEKLSSAEVSVAKESITTQSKETKAVVITYSFGEELVVDLFQIAVDWAEEMLAPIEKFAEDSMDESESLSAVMDEIMDELKAELEDYDLSFKLAFAVNPKTTDIMRIDLTGEDATDGGKATAVIDLGEVPVDSEKWSIELTSDIDSAEKITVDILRSESDSAFSRTLTAKSEIDGETQSAEIKFDYDKTSKAYTLSCTTNDESVIAKGTLEYTETTLKFTVDTVTVNEEEQDIGLEISFTTEGEVEAIPEFTNILTVDASELMSLIMGLAQAPSYGYDDDYSMDYGWDDGPLWDEGIFYETFDSTYDYDGDGDAGDDDDYNEWNMFYAPYTYDGWDGEEYYFVFNETFDYDYDSDAGDDDDRTEWEMQYLIYAEFNDKYDYDCDGYITDADRTEWEESYYPMVKFDPDYDYDGDGDTGDGDDQGIFWLYINTP